MVCVFVVVGCSVLFFMVAWFVCLTKPCSMQDISSLIRIPIHLPVEEWNLNHCTAFYATEIWELFLTTASFNPSCLVQDE